MDSKLVEKVKEINDTSILLLITALIWAALAAITVRKVAENSLELAKFDGQNLVVKKVTFFLFDSLIVLGEFKEDLLQFIVLIGFIHNIPHHQMLRYFLNELNRLALLFFSTFFLLFIDFAEWSSEEFSEGVVDEPEVNFFIWFKL